MCFGSIFNFYSIFHSVKLQTLTAGIKSMTRDVKSSLNMQIYSTTDTFLHCVATRSASVQVVGSPEALFSEEYTTQSFLLLGAVLQDNYSIQFCLEGRTSKAAETANLEQPVQR